MNSAKVVAASCGDTVKVLDISENDCALTYSPSPGSTVNSLKWNHNNMVLASAGDDGKVSFWRRNGTRLWVVPSKNDGAGIVESISSIDFCNKGSRYVCSGGTGQVVRVWDLQKKRCIKWLKGHRDTITGVMCNCKDEHVASVSRKGELIVHSLVSGATASNLKDPHAQVLVALDYSRTSRHLLVTTGDEGSVHLWDTTGHSPKVSWWKQHTAPATGVAFSPTNDKIIGSVGLDMKLYTFDTGWSKKPSSCIHHVAPFCSLAYSDDGLSIAAATTTGQVVLYDVRAKPQPLSVVDAYEHQAITSICWQRSKPVTFNKSNCTDETVLLAGDLGDFIIMPDPLPSTTSGFMSSEQPRLSGLLMNPTLARLHAPHNNVMDDMEVFSPIAEVQPLTPSFDILWESHDSPEKNIDRLIPSRRFGLSEEAASHENPISNTTLSKQVENRLSESTSNLAAARNSSGGPRKGWGGERALEKFIHRRHSTKTATSRFAKPSLMPSLRAKETSEAVLSSVLTKSINGQENSTPTSEPRSSPYASPKSKKTGSETREDILNNLLSNSQPPTPTTPNGGDDQTLHQISLQPNSSVDEETLASFRESIHGDMQNLHLEILRQFHVQEMGMSSVMRLILENQAEIMQEIQSLREQIQHFHHLL